MNVKEVPLHKATTIMLILTGCFVLLPFLVLAWYNHPALDDFGWTSCIVLVASGNYIRMVTQPNAAKPMWAILYALVLTGWSFYKWGLVLLTTSLLYIPVWGRLIHNRT